MLVLKNIQQNNNIISAEYYPELGKEKGYIKLDIRDNKTIEEKTTSYDKLFPMYSHHAKRGLQEYIKNKEDSKEKMIMWF